jgi:hypothetical protein
MSETLYRSDQRILYPRSSVGLARALNTGGNHRDPLVALERFRVNFLEAARDNDSIHAVVRIYMHLSEHQNCYPFVMATLNRYRVVWTGGPGGTGVSTFYSLDTATTALAAIRAFFDAVKGSFPSAISWAFPNNGDKIDSATGTLVGAWTQAAAATVAGGGASASYASGVGLRVQWDTGAILSGRRLRGATFMTSLAVGAYESDGTIGGTTLTSFSNAAATLVATDTIAIWSRNSPGSADGGYGTVEGFRIPDRVTALRSRRY